MDERMYNLFENCVARIFQKVGYDIKQNIYIEPGHREIDILAEKNMKKYYVEVKSSQITKKNHY